MSSLDKKITELPPVSSISMDDIVPIVHQGITSQVTLRALIGELNMSIPQPRIKISAARSGQSHTHDQVFAFWDSTDDKFLKHNPQFWLYRYRKADNSAAKFAKSIDQKALWRKKRFVHPSHLHGLVNVKQKDIQTGIELNLNLRSLNPGLVTENNLKSVSTTTILNPRLLPIAHEHTNLYKGQQMVMVDGLLTRLPGRQTEWRVNAAPFKETALAIEPWKYFRVQGQNGAQTLNATDFPLKKQPIPKGTGTSSARMVVFKLRIAIDNPDVNSKQSKLFGPFSETFIFYPHKIGEDFVSLKCYLGEEASPMLRGHKQGNVKFMK